MICENCGGEDGKHWFPQAVPIAGDKDCNRCQGTGREPLWRSDPLNPHVQYSIGLGLEPCAECGVRVCSYEPLLPGMGGGHCAMPEFIKKRLALSSYGRGVRDDL